MEIFKSISPVKIQELLNHIRKDVTGWKAVDITLEGGSDVGGLAEKLEAFFAGKNGAIFICGARKVLTLGKLGEKADLDALKQDIARALPGYSCAVSAGAVTKEGLETIAVRLTEIAEKTAPVSALDLLKKRMSRPQKVFFVVDDDAFMRSLVVRTLKPHGIVHEFGDGQDLVGHYLKEIPDVVFLDIHLPCGSGMDILDAIMHADHTAGIVMLSADKIKDNVLLAQARGAKGFIGKPFTKEKIDEATNKCLERAALLAK